MGINWSVTLSYGVILQREDEFITLGTAKLLRDHSDDYLIASDEELIERYGKGDCLKVYVDATVIEELKAELTVKEIWPDIPLAVELSGGDQDLSRILSIRSVTSEYYPITVPESFMTIEPELKAKFKTIVDSLRIKEEPRFILSSLYF